MSKKEAGDDNVPLFLREMELQDLAFALHRAMIARMLNLRRGFR